MPGHLLQTGVWCVFGTKNHEKRVWVKSVDTPFAKTQTESPFGESVKCGASSAIALLQQTYKFWLLRVAEVLLGKFELESGSNFLQNDRN
jgi:hypothetical protein